MNKLFLQNISEKINDKVFFLILFVYQILFIFQGMDFTDEGFFMTFYQQIFSNPESLVMNFMYWFSGIIGGVFYYLFPASGILGIRVLGIVIILSTSIITYNLLKSYMNVFNLRIGILLTILFVNSNDIKEMYYDNLSSLLIVSSALFIFKGLKNNKLTPIAISGAFISLSAFTRIPSITLLIFLVAIFYYAIINKNKLTLIAQQGFSFLTGFILMSIAVICLMQLIGHLSIYLENLRIVFGWGFSADDSHNLKQLIINFIHAYSKSLIWGIIVCIAPFVLNKIQNLLNEMPGIGSKIIDKLLKIIMVISFIFLLITNRITYYSLLTFFAGISLIAFIFILTGSRYSKEVKLLVFLGCSILLFAPLGSAGGLYAAGRNAFWIILPFAIDFLFSFKSIGSMIIITDNCDQDNLINISLDQKQLNTYKNNFMAMCVFVCLYFSYYYPYFDMSNRAKMFSTIDNKLAFGIFTTKERASAINDLLIESSKYVRKNDPVLTYDSFPMYYYLTETRPFLPNVWPWLYLPEQFDFELNNAVKKTNKLPVVILQKVNTLNSNWPQNYMIKIQRTTPENKRDSILNVFFENNAYTKVWENKAFEIRIPIE
jgi:hypothetical protein